MKAKRDYELVKNGKFILRAIMQRAWAYVRNFACAQYRNDFKGALKAAWIDARLAMDEYKSSFVKVEPIKQNGNMLRDFFLDSHPENRCYDSSWR